MDLLKKDIIFRDVRKLKGVGKQLASYLKNKKIEKIKDIVLNLPYSETDRSRIVKINNLEIGKIQTIEVKVLKLNFPRIRNLPNKILCEDNSGKIEITYFNSREGYLRKIFPINKIVVISGKVSFFNKKYQITNPDYVTTIDNKDYVKRLIPKYSLTKGVNEKKAITILKVATSIKSKTSRPLFIKIKELPQINERNTNILNWIIRKLNYVPVCTSKDFMEVGKLSPFL